MSWAVEVSDEFLRWYRALDDDQTESVNMAVDLLSEAGPTLGRPHVDSLYGSKIANLKELRVQHGGRPLRILFAFNPSRTCYLILGGDKGGDRGWYERLIPRAEKIYLQRLAETGD